MLNTEDLDGFTVEREDEHQIREYIVAQQSLAFDPKALNDAAAVRAVWILVVRGEWDKLAVLGVSKSELVPRLSRFSRYGERIDDRQVRRIRRLLPELERASLILRLLYVKKFIKEA